MIVITWAFSVGINGTNYAMPNDLDVVCGLIQRNIREIFSDPPADLSDQYQKEHTTYSSVDCVRLLMAEIGLVCYAS